MDLLSSLKWPGIRGKPSYYICKVDGVEVGFEDFAWAPDATVFTDGSALCVGFPVAVGGAAAFQVSVGPTGVTTVRSMVMALPIG